MNLFIDTNVFLSFFHFSSDDLEELKKLGLLVGRGNITLVVPEQVRSEFRRNRDGTIADALKRLRDQKLNLQIPQLCNEYDEYETFRTALRDADSARSALLMKLEDDIAKRALKADVTIADLFKKAKSLSETDAQFGRARDRMLRGNPPGKKTSNGDALNWEALLEAVPSGEDLFFVSGDGDWVSPLNGEQFDSFLDEEWLSRKQSKIVFYRRLSLFFREHFPQINLAAEQDKEDLITKLGSAGSFSRARSRLRRLAAHSDFTRDQLNEIAVAAVTNNQIYWIITDSDISRHLRRLLGPHVDKLEPELVVELERLLGRSLADIPEDASEG